MHLNGVVGERGDLEQEAQVEATREVGSRRREKVKSTVPLDVAQVGRF